jgi:glucose-1-phosphatase
MNTSSIELVIFDLGRVLIDFDFKKVVRELQRHTAMTEEQIHDFFLKTPLWDRFERGQIEPALFFAALEKDLALKGLTFEAFSTLWNDIFTEMPESVEILRQLRGRYKLAMLSNVNAMHWEHVAARHAFMKWFDHPVASYAVGYRKPDEEIFRIVLRKAGVAPEKAVFIDDIESHIHAAKAVGIRAYQFTNARQLQLDIADLL